MAGGRPTKYKPEYCQLMIEDLSSGFSFEAFAGLLRVSKDTLYEWANKYKEFSDAKKIAEALSQRYWEELGMSGINGKIQGFQQATYIFNMKNRFKWTDVHHMQVNKKDQRDEIEELSEEEIISLARKSSS